MNRPASLLLAVAQLVFTPLAVAQLPAIHFRLADQFEAEHDSADLAGRVVLVIASDRGAQDLNRAWGDALRLALAEDIEAGRAAVVPVAHLKGVPGPLRKGVRSRLPQDPGRWILLDWKGEIDAAYELQKGASNILMFGIDGGLATRIAATEFHEAQLQHLVALARSLRKD